MPRRRRFEFTCWWCGAIETHAGTELRGRGLFGWAHVGWLCEDCTIRLYRLRDTTRYGDLVDQLGPGSAVR